MTSLARVPTRRFIFVAIFLAAAAGVCNVIDKLAWHHAPALSRVFDAAGFILFWASYVLLWALLIAGPFRPQTGFSLHGDCSSRATHFFLALGGLIFLHLWGALAFAIAYS